MINLIRAYYLLFHVGLGCIFAFLPVYFETLGFSGKQISSIISLGALCGALGVPLFWGWLSDRWQNPERVLKILAFGTLIGCIPLLVLDNYYMIFASFAVYAVCSIGTMGILDTVASVRAKEQNLNYGRMRLFAPLGWFLGSVLLGYYLDYTGGSWNSPAIIIAFIGSFALMFLASLGLRHTSDIEQKEKTHFKQIIHLFSKHRMLLFYIMGMVNLLAITPYLAFYGPYVKELGLKPSIVGLSIGVGTASEVIIMFFFDKFKKWLGVEKLILLSIVISIIRWIIIANTRSAIVLVGVQVLHSEIGLFTISCVTYITDKIPKKLVTSAQTLFYVFTYGIGQFIGIRLMGFLYDYYGTGSRLFMTAAVIHVIPLLIMIFIMFRKNKQE